MSEITEFDDPAVDTLNLSHSLTSRLLSEARQQPRAEVCGFLSARDGVPHEIYPIANIAADKARRFEMDPAGQIAAFRRMRERGERVLAIYHSHPSSPAEPSARDIAGLGYPDALYLIISLDGNDAPELRVWRRADDGMTECPLTVMG